MKTTLAISELTNATRDRNRLQRAIEDYLLLGNEISALQKKQKEVREKKILPLSTSLNISVGTKITGETELEIEDEGGDTILETREWYLSHDEGAKRLQETLLRKKLLALGLNPIMIIDACKKPGKPSIRIAWSRKGEKREDEEDGNSDVEEE